VKQQKSIHPIPDITFESIFHNVVKNKMGVNKATKWQTMSVAYEISADSVRLFMYDMTVLN
jgi:hypothetical protein